jgi:hypothetical protein
LKARFSRCFCQWDIIGVYVTVVGLTNDEMTWFVETSSKVVVLRAGLDLNCLGLRMVERTTSDRLYDCSERVFSLCDLLGGDGICRRDGCTWKLPLV